MEARNTQIILYQKNHFWVSILESEGIPFQSIESIYELKDELGKKVLILWDRLNSEEVYQLKRWLSDKNVLITDKEYFNKISEENVQTVKFNYNDVDFSFVEKDSNCNTIDYLQSGFQSGLCIGLLSDIDKYWSNKKISYKKICIDLRKNIFTTESLNTVVKYNIRQYIRSILLRAVQHFNHPLIYVWRFPQNKASVCNLRIDVDPDRNSNPSIAQSKIDKTFGLAVGFEDRTTFMVNFYKRKDNLNFIDNYKHSSFDIQNHGYFHCLFPTFKHNLKNFELAHSILKSNGINPVGFTSPEYFWYDSTRTILESYNYQYSHSFGLDYNNYPYRPVIDGTITNYIEIPNDPLVYNKLIHAFQNKITPKQISDFYIKTLNDKIKTYDIPCLKYEHPAVLGEYPEIMGSIYSLFSTLEDVMPVTLTGWAKWLHKRNIFTNNVSINYHCKKDNSFISVKTDDELIDLSEFGIAYQYNEKEIFVKALESGCKNKYAFQDFRKYYRKESDTSINNIFSQRNEKKIDIFHSKKHLKKLISNYTLFLKYKNEGFYVNPD